MWQRVGGIRTGDREAGEVQAPVLSVPPGPRAGGRGVSRDLRQQPGFTQALQA